MLQHGTVEWAGGVMMPDCELLLSALDTYRLTLAVIDELLTNGVPRPPNGWCNLTARGAAQLRALAASMKSKRDDLCRNAIAAQCNPVPSECLQ